MIMRNKVQGVAFGVVLFSALCSSLSYASAPYVRYSAVSFAGDEVELVINDSTFELKSGNNVAFGDVTFKSLPGERCSLMKFDTPNNTMIKKALGSDTFAVRFTSKGLRVNSSKTGCDDSVKGIYFQEVSQIL